LKGKIDHFSIFVVDEVTPNQHVVLRQKPWPLLINKLKTDTLSVKRTKLKMPNLLLQQLQLLLNRKKVLMKMKMTNTKMLLLIALWNLGKHLKITRKLR
jgi:hypothetical protein